MSHTYEWVTHMNDGRCLLMLNAVNNTQSFATQRRVLLHSADFCYNTHFYATLCRLSAVAVLIDEYEYVVWYISMSRVTHMENVMYVIYDWVMSYMNVSYHIWMSHVVYGWVVSHMWVTSYMSYMNESYHIWMSHFIYEWVMSYMKQSCHTRMSRVIHMRNVIYVIYEWVMSYMNESYHIWMSHVVYEWVVSHIWITWCACEGVCYNTQIFGSGIADRWIWKSQSSWMLSRRLIFYFLYTHTHAHTHTHSLSLTHTQTHTHMNTLPLSQIHMHVHTNTHKTCIEPDAFLDVPVLFLTYIHTRVYRAECPLEGLFTYFWHT